MTSTEERVGQLEKRVAELEALVQTLILLAARSPAGRKILKAIAKAGQS